MLISSQWLRFELQRSRYNFSDEKKPANLSLLFFLIAENLKSLIWSCQYSLITLSSDFWVILLPFLSVFSIASFFHSLAPISHLLLILFFFLIFFLTVSTSMGDDSCEVWAGLVLFYSSSLQSMSLPESWQDERAIFSSSLYAPSAHHFPALPTLFNLPCFFLIFNYRPLDFLFPLPLAPPLPFSSQLMEL